MRIPPGVSRGIAVAEEAQNHVVFLENFLDELQRKVAGRN